MKLLELLRANAEQDAIEALAEKLEEENERLRATLAVIAESAEQVMGWHGGFHIEADPPCAACEPLSVIAELTHDHDHGGAELRALRECERLLRAKSEWHGRDRAHQTKAWHDEADAALAAYAAARDLCQNCTEGRHTLCDRKFVSAETLEPNGECGCACPLADAD